MKDDPNEHFEVCIMPLHGNDVAPKTFVFSVVEAARKSFEYAITDAYGLGGRKIILREVNGRTHRTLARSEVY